MAMAAMQTMQQPNQSALTKQAPKAVEAGVLQAQKEKAEANKAPAQSTGIDLKANGGLTPMDADREADAAWCFNLMKQGMSSQATSQRKN